MSNTTAMWLAESAVGRIIIHLYVIRMKIGRGFMRSLMIEWRGIVREL